MWKLPKRGPKRVPKSPAFGAARAQDAPDCHGPPQQQTRRGNRQRNRRYSNPSMHRTMNFDSRDIAARYPASQWPTAQSSSDSPCSKTLWASRRSGRASNRWRPVALTLRCLRVSGGRFCFTKSTAGQCVAEGRGRERLLSAGFCPFARRSMNGSIRPLSVDLAITNGLPGRGSLPRRADLDDLSDQEIRSLGLRSHVGATVLLHRRHGVEPHAAKMPRLQIPTTSCRFQCAR